MCSLQTALLVLSLALALLAADTTSAPTFSANMDSVKHETTHSVAFLQRLRRHLAQMFVGHHHFNHPRTQHNDTATRRHHSRRHRDRAIAGSRLAQA
uniref:Uncharacterized protein n=1 Tax=Biomphalaria glabrata TaxID=6526 RepID=A0A2C9KFR4_BIOGL